MPILPKSRSAHLGIRRSINATGAARCFSSMSSDGSSLFRRRLMRADFESMPRFEADSGSIPHRVAPILASEIRIENSGSSSPAVDPVVPAWNGLDC